VIARAKLREKKKKSEDAVPATRSGPVILPAGSCTPPTLSACLSMSRPSLVALMGAAAVVVVAAAAGATSIPPCAIGGEKRLQRPLN
jgi:hypothetical protein